MTTWTRINEIFHAALEQPTEARQRFIDEACAGDDALRSEVLSLLENDLNTLRVDQIIGSAAGDLIDDGASLTGKRLGPYRLVERIGYGGMGLVYRAERADQQFEKQVAIKLIRGTTSAVDLRERFLAERQILANLEHPGIARMLDGGATTQGVPYLVMEYVNGRPVDDYCQAQALDIEARLIVFLKICDAVEYAHQQLVVHCDLKMSNILVTDDGQPKLLDFGISRLLDDGELESHGGGDRRMTLRYSSPEQIRGERLGTATDTYSLGVILYELLAGAPPHADTTGDSAQLRNQIVEQDAPPVSQRAGNARIARQLRGDIDAIVQRALHKSADQRYASVESFADDIRRHLTHWPVEARPHTTAYAGTRFVRRHRGVAAMAATLAVVAVGFSASLWHKNRQVVAERDTARTQQERAEAVTKFVTDMFGEADPSKALGEDVTVRTALDRAAEKLAKDEAEDVPSDPLTEAAIRQAIGTVYDRLGRIDEAAAQLAGARALLQANDLTETDLYLQTLLSLERVFGMRFEHAEAASLSEEALALSRRLHGETHRDTLGILNNIAVRHHMTGELELAQRKFQEVHDLRVEALGEAHPDVITSVQNLGVIHHWLGDYDIAESNYWRCLEMSDRIGRAEHPQTLSCSSALGSLLVGTDRFSQAEPVIQTHIERATTILGDRHPAVLRSMNNLGIAYRGLGRFDAAEAQFLQTLAARRDALGEDHVETLQTEMNLARTYRLTGRLDEAMPLADHAAETMRDSQGVDHPSTLAARQEHAAVLTALNKLPDAQRAYADIIAVKESTLGDDAPGLIDSLAGLALVHLAAGELNDGEQQLRRGWSIVGQHPKASRLDIEAATRAFVEDLEASGLSDRAKALSQLAESVAQPA